MLPFFNLSLEFSLPMRDNVILYLLVGGSVPEACHGQPCHRGVRAAGRVPGEGPSSLHQRDRARSTDTVAFHTGRDGASRRTCGGLVSACDLVMRPSVARRRLESGEIGSAGSRTCRGYESLMSVCDKASATPRRESHSLPGGLGCLQATPSQCGSNVPPNSAFPSSPCR